MTYPDRYYPMTHRHLFPDMSFIVDPFSTYPQLLFVLQHYPVRSSKIQQDPLPSGNLLHSELERSTMLLMGKSWKIHYFYGHVQ